MTPAPIWPGWTVLGLSILVAIGVMVYAPEVIATLSIAWPVAVLLHTHDGPRQPIRLRNRKDRA